MISITPLFFEVSMRDDGEFRVYRLYSFWSFLGGLAILLIYAFSSSLPQFFGEFGKFLVFLIKPFPFWLALMLFGIGYIKTGYTYWRYATWRASGPRGFVLNPSDAVPGYLVWAFLWPIIAPINRRVTDY